MEFQEIEDLMTDQNDFGLQEVLLEILKQNNSLIRENVRLKKQADFWEKQNTQHTLIKHTDLPETPKSQEISKIECLACEMSQSVLSNQHEKYISAIGKLEALIDFQKKCADKRIASALEIAEGRMLITETSSIDFLKNRIVDKLKYENAYLLYILEKLATKVQASGLDIHPNLFQADFLLKNKDNFISEDPRLFTSINELVNANAKLEEYIIQVETSAYLRGFPSDGLAAPLSSELNFLARNISRDSTLCDLASKEYLIKEISELHSVQEQMLVKLQEVEQNNKKLSDVNLELNKCLNEIKSERDAKENEIEQRDKLIDDLKKELSSPANDEQRAGEMERQFMGLLEEQQVNFTRLLETLPPLKCNLEEGVLSIAKSYIERSHCEKDKLSYEIKNLIKDNKEFKNRIQKLTADNDYLNKSLETLKDEANNLRKNVDSDKKEAIIVDLENQLKLKVEQCTELDIKIKLQVKKLNTFKCFLLKLNHKKRMNNCFFVLNISSNLFKL